jgi:glutathione S-transferase
MNSASLTLVSHVLCPYVQRAVIMLTEKNAAFERRDIDLANKPQWFLDVSPLGKTPVLLVDDVAIFESSVICEYLDETTTPSMHPENAIERARHRGWMEFGSQVLGSIAGLYSAHDAAGLDAKAHDLTAKFQMLESALGSGPYFAGEMLSVVDAVFGPVFRYFEVLDTVDDFGGLKQRPKLLAWRAALAARASVKNAVVPDYAARLRAFLLARDSELARRMQAQLA